MTDVSDRIGYIGGSDAPVILGLSPWKSRLQLWAQKRGIAPSAAETESMEWGTRLEHVVATKYVEVTGRVIRRESRLLTHPDHPFLAAHIDRWQMDDEHPKRGILEVKTASSYRSEDWEDEPPLHYQAQLQHYLMITGATWGSFAVLIGGQKFKWFDQDRNEKFIAAMQEKEIEFWKLVQSGEMPLPGPFDSAVLSAIYGTETPDSVIELPPDALRIDLQLVEAKGQIADWMRKKEEAEAQLKAMLGTAAVGMLPGGGGWSWKTVNRKAYEVEAASYRQLRRVKE